MFLPNPNAAVEAARSFYTDWTFWSFVVAAIALIASLWVPVRRFLKATRLILEVHPRIALDHTFGNPQANLYMDLRNTGGRDVRVNEITMTVTRDGSEVREIPGQVYFEKTSSQEPLLLVPFNIQASDSWAHPVKFYALPGRQLDQKIRKNISDLRSDIDKKREAMGKEVSKTTAAIADEMLVRPLVELFNSQFFWKAGEYAITLNVLAEPLSGSLTRRFRFVVYESEAADLAVEVEDYKYGGGVYYQSSKHASIFPPIAAG
ncbi:MAG: hypothetical protein WBA33_14330 [Rhodanobacter lindaniclasticus]|jgi:hypothetical protein